MQSMTDLSDAVASAAEVLRKHPDYRILSRVAPTPYLYAGVPEGSVRIGVSVDVETTGLNKDSDKIIELAAQRFRFDELGRIIQIGTPRVWREDPQRPLDPRITMLTGLSDADLAGTTIDEEAAAEILNSADIIVAHNAAFDRPFVDRRLPAIGGKPWACSMAEIDWLELGFDGRALGHLVGQCGWFFEGHRAENDILALIYLLGHELGPDGTILAKLIASADRQTFRVNAIDAPFEAKDVLKARGYRWDATLRFWWATIGEDELETERHWLMEEVYPNYGAPAFHPQSACERYR